VSSETVLSRSIAICDGSGRQRWGSAEQTLSLDRPEAYDLARPRLDRERSSRWCLRIRHGWFGEGLRHSRRRRRRPL
jgi:hypothetical protein